ncbi:hypothetical protein DPV78_003746 [Talaromyces pinophilus]|nr:hypothetical protein DPV78_003746 [Talaromyces pinophilus]
MRDWAWAPAYWQTRVGSVLVLREDGEDLDLEHLAMMAYFLRGRIWRTEYKGKLRFSYDPSLAPIPQYTKRFEDYEMDPEPDSDLD